VRNKHIGSNFDDFLSEEGLLGEVEQGARKIGLAIELRKVMKRKRVTEAELARRLRTTRSVVRRILEPGEHEPRLDLLERVAVALGCALDVKVRAAPRKGTKRPPARRAA
jgi:transcriptional regulator with XRE-family HTH domain